MYEEEEKVRSEDECQQRIEDGGQGDEFHEICVFGGEVEQAEEHEHLHGFSQVEMHADVLAFEGLAVNGQAQVGGVDCADRHDG